MLNIEKKQKQIDNFRKEAHDALDKFLENYQFSVNGDWAPFTENDESVLYKLLEAIATAKFEPDCDGDLPINWHIINRTQYEGLRYANLPYIYKSPTLETIAQYIMNAHTNVRISNARLDDGIHALEFLLKNKK